RGEGRLFLLLLVAYGWLFVFFEKLNNPNELVRIYAARALAEEHSWSIGRRTRFGDTGPILQEWGYVNDKALVCDDPRLQPPNCEGRLFAAKAPGDPVGACRGEPPRRLLAAGRLEARARRSARRAAVGDRGRTIPLVRVRFALLHPVR